MCGGILYLMEHIKIKHIIITKQYENSENYRKFLSIAKTKKIKIKVVKESKIIIEKGVIFNMIWPDYENMIQNNAINNNSFVFKLVYYNFSMLFTGDIEEVAEKSILKRYVNNKEILRADIIKVAHHGSKTSSSEEFINTVSPKYAVIGVGQNNKFGHPSESVIKNLKKKNIQIYRTDKMGEIQINVNRKNKIKVRKFINN